MRKKRQWDKWDCDGELHSSGRRGGTVSGEAESIEARDNWILHARQGRIHNVMVRPKDLATHWFDRGRRGGMRQISKLWKAELGWKGIISR